MAAASKRAPRPSRRGRAANPARGEHTLALGGTAYLLRPSQGAVQAIEEALSLSAHQIMGRANAQALTNAEMGLICGELIRAGAAPDDALTAHVADDRIAELIFEAGTAGIYPLLTILFLGVITGGRDLEGNVKAVASPATA